MSSLSGKSILLVSDDATALARVREALEPLVKTLVCVSKDSEAVQKATAQAFDAVLLRTKTPILAEPKGFFMWSQMQKAHRKTPWIVLGKDIESDAVLVDYHHVKFLDGLEDMPALIRMLETVLFVPEKSGSAAGPDVNFINPVVGAVTEILKTMASLELRRGTPFVKTPSQKPVAVGDISGVIAMNSNRFMGSLALCFSKGLMLQIYKNMLQTEEKELNADVRDAVAELTNIIFGHAKRDLNASGHTIAPAIPSVITGPGHEITHSVDGACICIPFEHTSGKMVVECVMVARAV